MSCNSFIASSFVNFILCFLLVPFMSILSVVPPVGGTYYGMQFPIVGRVQNPIHAPMKYSKAASMISLYIIWYALFSMKVEFYLLYPWIFWQLWGVRHWVPQLSTRHGSSGSSLAPASRSIPTISS